MITKYGYNVVDYEIDIVSDINIETVGLVLAIYGNGRN